MRRLPASPRCAYAVRAGSAGGSTSDALDLFAAPTAMPPRARGGASNVNVCRATILRPATSGLTRWLAYQRTAMARRTQFSAYLISASNAPAAYAVHIGPASGSKPHASAGLIPVPWTSGRTDVDCIGQIHHTHTHTHTHALHYHTPHRTCTHYTTHLHTHTHTHHTHTHTPHAHAHTHTHTHTHPARTLYTHTHTPRTHTHTTHTHPTLYTHTAHHTYTHTTTHATHTTHRTTCLRGRKPNLWA